MKRVAMVLFVFMVLSEADANQYSSGKLKYSNAFHAELLGHGLNYSVSYEFFTLNQKKRKTSFQLGFGYHPFTTRHSELWVPDVIK
ncbi:MAG: hypothetical protein U5L09_07440 [Bacteroidales bacterium]|nr:hypothetical protein [Bacteroidales bacterium]